MEQIKNKPLKSAHYWNGYSDAQKQAERNWERARTELNSRFIDILESMKQVKGVGPKLHQAIVTHGLDILMGRSQVDVEQAEKPEISIKERSRIRKELANTKWSSLDDDVLIQLQNILTLNAKDTEEQA
jgi:hypothetical protein